MKIEAKGDSLLVVNDKRDTIRLAIDLYSILGLKQEYRLRPREEDFFVGCVLAFHEGLDLGTQRFINYMLNNYKFTKDVRQIYNFRSIMIKKKWFRPTGDSFDIPELFKGKINTLSVNVLIKSQEQ